ncbi:conserved hypothetical protein [Trichinella spiralis]|uniref:hypothetical protein n=1 Tax=Trichinella spiralis TaxID=6334 RepID=UPI0001EFEE31|nr:conserved hypothetical protein [Trichinella spiralis]
MSRPPPISKPSMMQPKDTRTCKRLESVRRSQGQPPAVPLVPTGTPALKQRRRSAINVTLAVPVNGVDLAQLVKRVGPGDEDAHARAKEANGCAILKRVAMMKTELRRAFISSM